MSSEYRSSTVPSARSLLAVTALLALLVPSVDAQRNRRQQTPPPATLPGFAEAIDVRVVNVEVVVTDKDGNRVRDLERDDFQLEVDGEATPIDFFTEVADGQARERGEGDGVGVGAIDDGEPLRTNYLIFVDDHFLIPRDRNRVLDNLRAQLGGLSSLDRVAMVAFDGSQIDLLTSWTGDRAEILRALDVASGRKAFGLQRLGELRTNDIERRQRANLELTQRERLEAAGGAPPQDFMNVRLRPIELAYANRLVDQVDKSVLASVSALRSFAGPPGRRVMLIVSGGWPMSVTEYTVNDFRATATDMASGALDTNFPGPGEQFQSLVDTANLLGYTLYPIDAPGQNRQIGVEASEILGSFNEFGPADGAGGTILARELQVHFALDEVAKRTGGKALINSARDHALDRVIGDTRSFYWLGFSPQRNEDDAQHDIEISVVGRPGLEVRSRDSYVDLSRSTEVTMMVESSLLFGDPPSTKPLAITFERPSKRRGKLELPVEVGISMDEITLIPQNGRWVNELEIRFTVMDAAGGRSETVVDKIPIDGAYEPKPGQSYFYETTLRLRNRPHRLVVAVYDPISGSILSSSGEVNQ